MTVNVSSGWCLTFSRDSYLGAELKRLRLLLGVPRIFGVLQEFLLCSPRRGSDLLGGQPIQIGSKHFPDLFTVSFQARRKPMSQCGHELGNVKLVIPF